MIIVVTGKSDSNIFSLITISYINLQVGLNPPIVGNLRTTDINETTDTGSHSVNPSPRDDIPAVLLGLQHLYSHEETREKLFSLLEEHIVPGTNRNVGRPMELWPW